MFSAFVKSTFIPKALALAITIATNWITKNPTAVQFCSFSGMSLALFFSAYLASKKFAISISISAYFSPISGYLSANLFC